MNKKHLSTVILLYIGYFVDFYDLTIFSANYSVIIKDLFAIHNQTQIQLTYLMITNFYTFGIIIGSVSFGILGDKFGRVTVIRYSILLYSITIIASIFTKSILLFTFLRFLSGAGLAAEFALSSVLIHELLPIKTATRSTLLLYFCGILGGMTATFIGSISWKIMFLFGGGAGIILYICRQKLFESEVFQNLSPQIKRGNISILYNSLPNILKTIRLLLLIAPFYFLISVMFILPSFMNLKQPLTELIHTLLLGFFIGNLISVIIADYITNKFQDYRTYLLISFITFALILLGFKFISQDTFLLYAIFIGLVGGGLPAIWIQIVIKNYGTNQRSTATNGLYALGRGSGIIFNLLIGTWIAMPESFLVYFIITVISILLLSLVALIFTTNLYSQKINYIEEIRNG